MSCSLRSPVTDHFVIKVAILPPVNRFSEWWDCEFRLEDGRQKDCGGGGDYLLCPPLLNYTLPASREHKICVRNARERSRGGSTESSKSAPTLLENGHGRGSNFAWFGSLTAAPPRLRRPLPQMGFYLARSFDSTCGLIAEFREVIHQFFVVGSGARRCHIY